MQFPLPLQAFAAKGKSIAVAMANDNPRNGRRTFFMRRSHPDASQLEWLSRGHNAPFCRSQALSAIHISDAAVRFHH